MAEFWIADPATGKADRVWKDPVDDPSYAGSGPGFGRGGGLNIEWAGNNLVFRAERNNWQHYYSVPVDGRDVAPVNLTPGEGEAESVGYSSDGKYLFYSSNVNDIDRRHLWKTPTAGGDPVQLTRGDSIETYPVALASEKRSRSSMPARSSR